MIVGTALVITGVISIAALWVQLLWYDPPCAPLLAASLTGACGALRLLVLLMMPFVLGGLALGAYGLVLRHGAGRARG